VLVVNVGRTRVIVASAATVARAPPVPSALNTATRRRRVAINNVIPTIPLIVIITAAKTVSRASALASSLAEIMIVTISATSITVTATARISDPYGSPTRRATTSA
jgi:hypothetical protein